MNLNGLWQFAPAASGDPPPQGRDLVGQILVPFPVESALSGVMGEAGLSGFGTVVMLPRASYAG